MSRILQKPQNMKHLILWVEVVDKKKALYIFTLCRNYAVNRLSQHHSLLLAK